jgi:hypothetical protein
MTSPGNNPASSEAPHPTTTRQVRRRGRRGFPMFARERAAAGSRPGGRAAGASPSNEGAAAGVH